jgi:hypothetical protein
LDKWSNAITDSLPRFHPTCIPRLFEGADTARDDLSGFVYKIQIIDVLISTVVSRVSIVSTAGSTHVELLSKRGSANLIQLWTQSAKSGFCKSSTLLALNAINRTLK